MTEGIAPVWRSRRRFSCQGLAAQGNNIGGMQFKSGLKNAWLGPDRSQCTSVEVPEEPQLPRARGARQQPQSGLKIACLGS